MAGLDKKYNLAKKRQLSSRESPRKIRKLQELTNCHHLGIKYEQYKTLKEGLKMSVVEKPEEVKVSVVDFLVLNNIFWINLNF